MDDGSGTPCFASRNHSFLLPKLLPSQADWSSGLESDPSSEIMAKLQEFEEDDCLSSSKVETDPISRPSPLLSRKAYSDPGSCIQ